jgi:hypothetical protein
MRVSNVIPSRKLCSPMKNMDVKVALTKEVRPSKDEDDQTLGRVLTINVNTNTQYVIIFGIQKYYITIPIMLHKVLIIHHRYSMNVDCVSYRWQCCKSINKLHHYFSLQNNNPLWSCSTSEWAILVSNLPT